MTSRRLAAACFLLYGVLLWPGLLALLLLATAETTAGGVFAVDALVLLAVPAVLGRALRGRGRRRFLPVLVVGIAGVGLFGVLAALSPPGAAPAGSTVATRYLRLPYRRWALANLLPEIDQLKLGTYLVQYAGQSVSDAQARHLREVVLRVYRPMEADPALRALGSAMTYAYADADSGHLYEVVPPHRSDERLPAVVFLHGSAGNFKGYLAVWKAMAEAERFIVVAPSFGLGNWQREGGTAAVERARRHAIRGLGADPRRIFLAGLSNGGRGVTRAMAETTERRYAGVILLSAITEPELVEGGAAWRSTPVLVVHGERDDRIPWDYVEEGVRVLEAAGAEVTIRTAPNEDHFLFFSRAALVRGWIADWLRERREP